MKSTVKLGIDLGTTVPPVDELPKARRYGVASQEVRSSPEDPSEHTSRIGAVTAPELGFSVAGVRSASSMAACMITSKNHLAFARVLAQSFHLHHPDIPFFLLLVDRISGNFVPEDEPFQVVELEALGIPDLPSFCFKYSVTELNCAVKPFFLEFLLRRFNIRKLIFFDPDILVLQPVSDVYDLLDHHSVVVTPHLVAPPRHDSLHAEGQIYWELEILQSGTFNLGFLAISNTATTHEFLKWWQSRLYDHCQMAHNRGMHTDQRWVDLAPSLFGDVFVLRHPGYNAAYWNLRQRTLELRDGVFFSNGELLHFYHFSGFDPHNGAAVSRHDTTLSVKSLGDAELLFTRYGELLLAHGYDDARRWPYAFGQFDNGARIHDAARALHLRLGEGARAFGNPFSTSGKGTFFEWLNAGVDRDTSKWRVTRLWHEIYQRREDLKKAYPDPLGRDRRDFALWTRSSGHHEERIDPRMIPIMLGAKADITLPHAVRVVRATELSGRPFGVNVAGYVASEKGTGAGVRSDIEFLQAADVPFVVNSIRDQHGAQNHERIAAGAVISEDNPYRVNLLHVNADQVPVIVKTLPSGYLRGHFNIGYWAWELSDFPNTWHQSFNHFDEIWVPSRFVHDAVSPASPIPVVRIPHCIADRTRHVAPARARLHYGIDEDAFVVLFVFDFYSYFARKNPLAVVEAFSEAFAGTPDAKLVIKAGHPEFDPANAARLRRACKRVGGIVVDNVLSREDLGDLMASADCYISLHRSEGFGLTMAEAMLMAKPVVATGYSGNTDFMTDENSFPVRFRLREIRGDAGPYKEGGCWAEPDTAHAAELLQTVYRDRDRATCVANQGRKTILAQFSPKAIGQRARTRLQRVAGDDHCDDF